MQHVFIIGSKGIPGAYGGYETFVDKLTEHHKDDKEIQYHVACKSQEEGEFDYHNAHCFKVKVPDIGSVQAIYYDVAALEKCCNYIKKNSIKQPIIYILACRIGPFSAYFKNVIHKLGGVIFVNPDGHEWMRQKWPIPVRKYWKISEQMMVKHADLLICDSKNIEEYINKKYTSYNPKTTFIAYGAETRKSTLGDDDEALKIWYKKNGLSPKNYYLVVGRFVPENNYEVILREFIKSKSRKDLVIITNKTGKFYDILRKKTDFEKDLRIKFVGTVYAQEMLMKIRENAFGYFHGHEVGGTNPSLLEALAATKLNLLLDVGFNREVAETGALYWNKKEGMLSALIDKADSLSKEEIEELGRKSRERILDWYSWEYICTRYREVFLRKQNVGVGDEDTGCT